MKSREDMIWQALSHFVLVLLSFFALVPFVLLFVASFTDNKWAIANGFSFFPEVWSLDAYRFIAQEIDTLGRAYLMSIFVTALGTIGSVFVTAGFAYALANRELPGNRLLNFLCIFTMLFNGGIVASYYCWVSIFKIRDTLWALILPNLFMRAFNVILVRNYFTNNIPSSIIKSARIEGASEFRIYRQIVLPLSLPIIATIGVMIGIAYWNDWINGLYYLTHRKGRKLFTIQLVLNNINENIRFLSANTTSSALSAIELPSVTIRMAISAIGILPIIIAYPFFQKYFVKGITLGGVKG